MTATAAEQMIHTSWGDVMCGINSDGALARLELLKENSDSSRDDRVGVGPSPAPNDPFTAIAAQLEEYFAGERREFDIELAPMGTPFQLSVWRELLDIPYGTTTTYAQLAQRIGKPEAVRAVGTANGANPIWIVIPCHRVIGADGSLTGYAGGIDVKRRLLELEGSLPPRLFD